MGTVRLSSGERWGVSQQGSLAGFFRIDSLVTSSFRILSSGKEAIHCTPTLTPAPYSPTPHPELFHLSRSVHETPTEKELTRLPNQQKEPHAPRQVNHQRNRISRVSQNISQLEKCAVDPSFERAVLHRGRRERGVRTRFVCFGARADEWRCEAPCYADEEEAEDVVEDWGVGGVF